METLQLPHLPTHTLLLTLITSVTNASHLRTQLLASNPQFEYTFLDAQIILSRTHVLAAAFRAINDANQTRLKTKNVHSEVVYSLSPNNNISESFRRFGIQDSTTTLLAIKILPNGEDLARNLEFHERHLRDEIQGEIIPFTDEVLRERGFCDAERVRKIYRLGKGADVWGEEARGVVLGSMALKGS